MSSSTTNDAVQTEGTPGALLYERLLVGFENPEDHSGICQFEMSGPSPETFHLVLQGSQLQFSAGGHPQPTAVVRMSSAMAREIALGDNINLLDPRNLDQIEADGDPVLIGMLAQMTKLPRQDASERFRQAEEHAAKQPRVERVERIARPTTEQAARAIETSAPIIATGLLSELWPEAVSWTFESIEASFGEVMVRSNLGMTTIRDFLAHLRQHADAEDPPYTFGAPAPDELVPYCPPPFFDAASFGPAQIWMGSGPNHISTNLHRDSGEAFLGQIIGRKHVILYSPDQTEYVYPFRSFNRDQPCWVNAWEPDYEKYPRFRDARPLELTLHPGELLLIPRGWYHTVKALELTLSIGFHREPVSDFGRIVESRD